MRYKLNPSKDIDRTEDGFMLYLPYGFRFYDDLVHCRGFDTMAELKAAARSDVVVCDCDECAAAKNPSAADEVTA